METSVKDVESALEGLTDEELLMYGENSEELIEFLNRKTNATINLVVNVEVQDCISRFLNQKFSGANEKNGQRSGHSMKPKGGNTKPAFQGFGFNTLSDKGKMAGKDNKPKTGNKVSNLPNVGGTMKTSSRVKNSGGKRKKK